MKRAQELRDPTGHRTGQPVGLRPSGGAPRMLELQRSHGNRWVTRLLTSSARTVTAQPATVQRRWVKGSVDSPDEWEMWDQIVEKKRWYRRLGTSGDTEYRYSVVKGFDYRDHEGQSRSRTQWEALNLVPPEGESPLVVEDYPAANLPQSEGKGWDAKTLIEVLVQHGRQGVCNSMTAAYLVNEIAPGSSGLTGVHENNFNKIVLVKQLLDRAVESFRRYDSTDITFAFTSYVKHAALGSAWFAALSTSNMGKEYDLFSRYLRNEWDAGAGVKPAREDLEDRNEDLSPNDLTDLCVDALEPIFSVDRPLRGTVSIKAMAAKGDSDEPDGRIKTAGHEIAVRYRPNGRLFEILDQNSGLRQQVIADGDDAGAMLGAYLHKYYVAQPMPLEHEGKTLPSNMARFIVLLYPDG